MTTFLLEVGTEEIPARMAPGGVAELEARFRKECEALRLPVSDLRTAVTPRRLILTAGSIPDRQEDIVADVLGPPAAVAFKDGQPTKAAEGFARREGVDLSALSVVDTPKGPYVSARKHVQGRPVGALLAEVLPRLLASMPWPKAMRWGRGGQPFVRPVHWIVALLGSEVVPFEFAGVRSGRTTYGHRFMAPQGITVTGPDALLAALAQAHVLVDPEERRRLIREQVATLGSAGGGRAISDEGLVEEVTHLVEWPHLTRGTFDPAFLALPREVLVTSMRSHQRYFALEAADGSLLNHFLVASNTLARDMDLVTRGNQRVLAARLSDAQFFFAEDRKRPLEDYVERLSQRIFLAGLGTVREKAERLVALSGAIAAACAPGAASLAERAALLCKADLATHMVGEFPDLQGVMGREYAKHSGEPEAVATAIYEHYQPRFAGDAVPASDAGAIVAVADKIDSIVGCFGLGLLPTGTQDPYALRRGALGIIHTFLGRGWTLPLRVLIAHAIGAYDGRLTRPAADVTEDVVEFFRGRLRSLLQGDHATDVIEAVLATPGDVLVDLVAKVKALSALRSREDFEPLAIAFKRVMNITKGQPIGPDGPDADLLDSDQERALLAETRRIGAEARALVGCCDFDGALCALAGLKPAVDAFFDHVMVMVDDDAVRQNRLALLGEIRALFADIADFGRIQTPGAGAR
ncbi:MAG: glycine--tRNA ligase beta subunit [Myxococcales bacterium]